jgi:choline dehydrogenase-like flavoprotein
MTTVVIGSGPAGAAATRALCEAGERVIVLDAGDRIEPGGMELFDTLGQSDPDRWPPELVDRARRSFPVGLGEHVPRKPAFGSLFLYAMDSRDLPLRCSNADVLSSLAYGGLSNAWGASILPFRQADIADWPITLEDLRPHYEAVLRFVPIAAEHDGLAKLLPLYTDAPGSLRRTAQTELALGHMRLHAAALGADGVTFGASRLAVQATPGHAHRCRYGGTCLYGCPYGSVYNAARTLDALAREGDIEYRGGVYVDRLTERDGSVDIDFHARGRRRETGRLTASRVLVACGAISSTRLMLESLGRAGTPRRLHDGMYFTVPMVSLRGAPVSVAAQGNTLAQIFMEVDDARVSDHVVHLQIYGYNDIMLATVAKRLPLAPARVERLLRGVLGRVLFVQGFLHSRESPGLTLACEPGGSVQVTGERASAATARVRRLVRGLAAKARLLGMAPLPALLHVEPPGKSNHIGGSLPMRRAPGELETDVLGRVPGWHRVHVVDATTFPSFPATTVTISIMANAHRIASAVARLGSEPRN